MLHGREFETSVLDRVLSDARAGRSGVLVLRGEPGIGKTALLDHLVGSATGCRVVSVAGVQSEMELPYAGLQQLFSQLPGRLDRLPEPQRDAIRVAFGLAAGPPPSRYLVNMATLTLFAETGAERPLVCAVDDAHWLDRASLQALAFVARRLLAEPVALVFVRRLDYPGPDETAGLDELVVEGLDPEAARTVLAGVVRGRLDEDVLARLVAEAHGNPLALLELPRGASPDALAGGFGLAGALTMRGPLEHSFQQRVLDLPEESRSLMLLAAADPTGDSSLLWRAAAILGIPADALRPVEEDELMSVGPLVRFRHPLVRAAAYQVATLDARRRVHHALAEATDATQDPDRRAWHRALAAVGPDEELAEELERSAERAQARGGLFAAAAFLERTVDLTLDPVLRGRRALAAAQVKELAGGQESAIELVRIAEATPLADEERALARRLRGRVALNLERGRGASRLLLEAAGLLLPHDPEVGRGVYLEALAAAIFIADVGEGPGVREVADAARAASSADADGPVTDRMLDALSALVVEGPEAAAGPLADAVALLRGEAVPVELAVRWMWLGCRLASMSWDDEAWREIAERGSVLARAAGSFVAIPATLSSYAAYLTFAGDLDAAAAAADEAADAWSAIGIAPPAYAAGVVAAWSGDAVAGAEVLDAAEELFAERGEGMGLALVHWARAVLGNSLGRYADALANAEAAGRFPPGMQYLAWGLSEAVEAATRLGEQQRAEEAYERLRRWTSAFATDWACGVELRARALVAAEDAEEHFRGSVAHLERTAMKAELARTRLVYGEWLRRRRRRQDARVQLSAAHDLFVAMGAAGFADRAARELAATGAPARTAAPRERDQLSTQEARIAELASSGLSNAEIGATMFISASTVDYHLRKVFRKLDITSRTQLHLVLGADGRRGT
ncbi:helix-turn-helix transcriptional regulator [Marmoricola sp. RAF53]|uniref:helix-turn-helix transcriptional regulator n=1 Tax=Marmoricola sp. RAF53 TaxID=3233059 RepID=UPI003F98B84A